MADASLIEGPGPTWKYLIRDLPAFRAALGDDVLAAACSCFVHTDRLNSLITFMYLSTQRFAPDTVAHSRNLHAMVWFAVGTMRELAIAVRSLRSALAKRGLLDPSSAPWLKLRAFEDRWENDAFLRDFRNKVAFHVEASAVAAGRDALCDDHPEVILCEGDGPKGHETSFRIGMEALLKGLGVDVTAYGPFFQTVSDDQGIGFVLEEALIALMDKVGIVHDRRSAEVM